MSRDDAGSHLLFFAVGAAVGAGLGLLFAPRAGSQTRERIADWLDERREKGKELIAKVKESVPEISKVKDTVSEKKEQLAAAIKAGKEAFQGARHNHADKEPIEA